MYFVQHVLEIGLPNSIKKEPWLRPELFVLSPVFMLSVHQGGGPLKPLEHAYKITGVHIPQFLRNLHHAVVAAAQPLFCPLYFLPIHVVYEVFPQFPAEQA